MRSLNKLLWLRKIINDVRRRWLASIVGADIEPGASISLSSKLIAGRKGEIKVSDGTLVAFKTLLIARTPDGSVKPIRIGRHCFIGGGATILPGVTIADECIIGAGAVVFEDVPMRCIVGGNPARELRENIEVRRFGRLSIADENSKKYWRN